MDYFSFVKKNPPLGGLYRNMRKDNDWGIAEFLLSYHTIIHDHSMIDTISVGFIECFECLRYNISSSCSYLYWCEFIGFIFNEYEWYLGSWFFPVESDIVCRWEFAIELYEYEVLDNSLLVATMIVSNSECSMEKREITEIYLHMSREFCSSILYPRSNSSDKIIFQDDLSIFAYFASGYIHIFGNSFFFEYISYIHSNGSYEF